MQSESDSALYDWGLQLHVLPCKGSHSSEQRAELDTFSRE